MLHPGAQAPVWLFCFAAAAQGQLVGRMDAKMHRKTGMLEIIALWLEEGIKVTAGLEKGLTTALSEFARWQGAHETCTRSRACLGAVYDLSRWLGNRHSLKREYDKL